MKLAIFSQIPNSASCFYRALFPFKALSAAMNFQYEVLGGEETVMSMNKLYEFDLCFMMRPHDPGHVQVLRTMKDMGIPLWIDYDDDLFAIPFDHKEWDYFQNEVTEQSIIDSCELANVITVTTERIKEVLVAKNIHAEKIKVIPNAINDYLYPKPTPHDETKNQTICWRGGFTHDRDLKTIGPAFSILAKKGFRFIFMGHTPHAVEEYLIPTTFSRIAEQDIFTYVDSLKRINAPFHIVPLQDNRLNRAKSNLAYLEAAWIGGSVVIAPEWCEHKGAIGYANVDNLVFILEDKKTELSFRRALYNSAIENIQDNYLLSKVNDERMKLLMYLGIE